MVVVQAEVADVDLHLFSLNRLLATELLPDLEKSFLDFPFDPWLQLLLHVVQLEVLAFEILKRVALLFGITRLHVLHYRLAVLQL